MVQGLFTELLRGISKQAEEAQVGSEVLQQRALTTSLMIPLLKGKKYRVARKMANLLIRAHINNKEVGNFFLAKCLRIKFSGTNPKLTKKKYKENPGKYNDKIQNCFRTLKRIWKPMGYDIQFNKNTSKIIKLNST